MTKKRTLTEHYRELNDFYDEEIYELGYENEEEDAEYNQYFESYYDPNDNPYFDIEEIIDDMEEELRENDKINY